MAKRKGTNNDLQNTTQKTKERATRRTFWRYQKGNQNRKPKNDRHHNYQKEKKTIGQTIIYKTLHRKLKIELPGTRRKVEDTKGVKWSRKPKKDRQHNGQKKRNKREKTIYETLHRKLKLGIHEEKYEDTKGETRNRRRTYIAMIKRKKYKRTNNDLQKTSRKNKDRTVFLRNHMSGVLEI